MEPPHCSYISISKINTIFTCDAIKYWYLMCLKFILWKYCEVYFEYLQDILKFIEESQNGVIYFSFGTVVALSTLPDHIQNAFKNALAEVPQRVLLKFEGEMKDKPKNMMTSKWLPQRDILSTIP